MFVLKLAMVVKKRKGVPIGIQSIVVLVLLTAATACRRAHKPELPAYRAPDVKVPSGKGEGFPDDFLFVCDKTIRNVSEDLRKNAIAIEGTSERRDLEGPGCDGRKTLMPKFPRYNFHEDLTIRPPTDLKGKVRYAEIENTRTCASRRVTFAASNQPTSFDSREWRQKPYWIGGQSTIVIGLTDSPAKIFTPGLNVLNGQNILSVVYFGQCIEKSKETGECIKGEELGRQTILVGVKIESREINGIDTMESLCHLYIPPGERAK